MSCVSTTGSTLCPHFAGLWKCEYTHCARAYRLLRTDGTDRIAYLPILGAADATAFDNYVRESASTNVSETGFAQAMITDEGCTGWNGTGLRYHLSAVCSVLVYNGVVSCTDAAAAAQTNVLCASTMITFIDSWFNVINNTAFCPAGGNAAELATYITSFTASVITLPTDSSNCVSFERGDESTCGFGSLAEADSYCLANLSDTCCQSLFDVATASSNASSDSSQITAADDSTGTVPTTSTNASSSAFVASAAAGGLASDSAAVSNTIFPTLTIAGTLSAPTAPESSVANADASSSTSSSGSSTLPVVLIVGILGGVIVLVAILISVICCIRRRRRRSQYSDSSSISPAGSPAAKGLNEETVNLIKGVMVAGVPPIRDGKRANYDYTATRGDEMDVAVGDLIAVKLTYDDGWATGLNTMTMQRGFFPLDILEESSNSKNRRSKFLDFSRRSSSANSDGYTSMYIPAPKGGGADSALFYDRSSNPVAANTAYVPLPTSANGDYDSELAVVGAAAAFIEVAKIGSDEVVADFVATKSDEISVQVGDRVLVTKSFDDGWCLGIVLNTQIEGYFPYDCLASYALTNSHLSNTSSTGHSPRNSSVSGKPYKPGLLVLQDFLPIQDDELGLKAGDRILVEKTFDDGWASGYNVTSKEKGMFPMNYVAGLSRDHGTYRVSTRSSSYHVRSTYRKSGYLSSPSL
ncbi:hypothetical protein HDU83_006931 [Entophlyctis luteolus]|nr:hypothetical protein HDU83_006931 [Entophlyctis luteolus]